LSALPAGAPVFHEQFLQDAIQIVQKTARSDINTNTIEGYFLGSGPIKGIPKPAVI